MNEDFISKSRVSAEIKNMVAKNLTVLLLSL